MAEIDIQKKNRKPLWPWFVLLIVIIFALLAIYWFSIHDGSMGEREILNEERVNVMSMDNTVDDESMSLIKAAVSSYSHYTTALAQFHNG